MDKTIHKTETFNCNDKSHMTSNQGTASKKLSFTQGSSQNIRESNHPSSQSRTPGRQFAPLQKQRRFSHLTLYSNVTDHRENSTLDQKVTFKLHPKPISEFDPKLTSRPDLYNKGSKQSGAKYAVDMMIRRRSIIKKTSKESATSGVGSIHKDQEAQGSVKATVQDANPGTLKDKALVKHRRRFFPTIQRRKVRFQSFY